MNKQELWQRYLTYFRHYPEIGLTLDISRMRFPDSFLSKMRPLADQAFAEMAALEGGAVANADEKRMVGHYWLRTPELAPTPEIKAAIISCTEQISAFSRDILSGVTKSERGKPFSKVVIVGIGGSALGPQLLVDALGRVPSAIEMYFCDNTDPNGIEQTIKRLGVGLSECLTIVISKSGGTVETRNGQLEFAAAYQRAGLDFAKHAVAVTCESSKLDNQAKEEGWLRRFPLWDWVGGRTSIFSAVGLLPGALLGIDLNQFILGAQRMDAITRVADHSANPALLLALMWHFAGDGKGKKDMVVLPYRDRLVLMSKYLQQLVMESLGKEKDRDGKVVNQGIAVYGNKGSTDQHAYIQQLRDGLNNFFVTFIEVLSDASEGDTSISAIEVEPHITSGDYLCGFLLGTREALFENNRDSVCLTFDRLNTQSVAALIALYERAVGYYASMVNVNAYHQPGVEAGKKAAAKVIELQRKTLAVLGKSGSTALSSSEIALQLGAVEESETIFKILEHLSANSSRRIIREGDRHPKVARYRIKS